MNWYAYPPNIVRVLWKKSIWKSQTDKILLTFDDSPTKDVTETILQKLSEHNIKSIFFCSGCKAEKNTNLVSEIIKDGHTVGNHGFTHRSMLWQSAGSIANEIEQGNHVLKECGIDKIDFFRPPYGRFNFSLKRELERRRMVCVMWDLLSLDYKNNLKLVKSTVEKYLSENSIVVFHDNIKTKGIIIDALDILLNVADRKGFAIGNPMECLK